MGGLGETCFDKPNNLAKNNPVFRVLCEFEKRKRGDKKKKKEALTLNFQTRNQLQTQLNGFQAVPAKPASAELCLCNPVRQAPSPSQVQLDSCNAAASPL